MRWVRDHHHHPPCRGASPQQSAHARPVMQSILQNTSECVLDVCVCVVWCCVVLCVVWCDESEKSWEDKANVEEKEEMYVSLRRCCWSASPTHNIHHTSIDPEIASLRDAQEQKRSWISAFKSDVARTDTRTQRIVGAAGLPDHCMLSQRTPSVRIMMLYHLHPPPPCCTTSWMSCATWHRQ